MLAGRRKLDPVVDRRDMIGLRAAARRSGGPDLLAIHAGQCLQEIDRANRVPQLQPERPEAPELLHRLVAEIVRRLDGVVVAHHVVGEDHVALAREVDRARGNGGDVGVLQAAVVPMAVRLRAPREIRRPGAGLSGR